MDDLGLPSVFRVGEFAAWTVTAAHAQAAAFFAARNGLSAPPEVRVGVREAAIAFRSERYLRVDGEAAFEWAPLSGDYEAADGWVRLHCNFEHHAAIACRVLGVPQERDAVAAAVRRRGRFELEDAIAQAGGVAAAMRTREEWLAHPQSAVVAGRPVVAMAPLGGGEVFAADCGVAGGTGGTGGIGSVGSAGLAGAGGSGPAGGAAITNRELVPSSRPLSGIRVLDLTRIIAGPNAGRVLAGHGADVTMVRSPLLPTIRGLDLDLNVGKALRFLDLRTDAGHAAFLDLVRDADIVLQSYRPGALAKLGLGPADLAAVNPNLVHVSISAYGADGPWDGRRGFDSLVQMATGIAEEGMRAAGAERPVPLPAQVLDHGAGWLAAAGAIEALRRGGGLAVDVSLAGVGHAVDSLGRLDPAVGLAVPDPALSDVEDLLLREPSAVGELTRVRFPGSVAGAALGWSGPPPLG
ncbi:CoA transferase [Catenulispora sp. NL8]|uniref:CoA transferase n=1 Tax=Catenulispora pinistramenti TaxID=2705254 RepID=A0ABS5KWT8_9ACTN|nr:CoA transferase [Catenulispora pinistramenti]MBS2550541.1 CoA transferase [Catenulispora pinistramenti]